MPTYTLYGKHISALIALYQWIFVYLQHNFKTFGLTLSEVNHTYLEMAVVTKSVKEALQYIGTIVLSLLSALWLLITGKRIK